MSEKSRRAASRRRAAVPAGSAQPAQSVQSTQSRPSIAPKKPRAAMAFVERLFEGLPAEAELVVMREIPPLVTLPVTATEEYGSADVVLTTVLPSIAGTLRWVDGVFLVITQAVMSSEDISRDIATWIIDRIELPNGQAFQVPDLPEPGPRLQSVVVSFGKLELHEIPPFWMTEEDATRPENKEAFEDPWFQLVPMRAVDGVRDAFRCRMGRKLARWVGPEPHNAVFDGLVGLRTADDFSLDGSRFVDAFRALGLIIPVWKLPKGAEADELVAPMAEFAPKLNTVTATSDPLTPEEKRTQAGIASR